MTQREIERLYLVTGSKNKFEDYEFLLGKYAELRWLKTNLEDVVTTDLDILVRRKIAAAKPLLPYLDFVVEQTNLMLEAWRHMPGNVTGMFIDAIGEAGICQMVHSFANKRATAVTALGYHAADGKVYIFRGEVDGRIVDEPRGSQGFGWDTIFIPDGHTKTFAEMSLDQRNSLSTRNQAVIKFYTDFLKAEDAGALLQNRIRLRKLMTDYFTKQELEMLCFDLQIDRDELRGSIKTELAQEIILYCERFKLISFLLELCRQQRPNTEWPDAL